MNSNNFIRMGKKITLLTGFNGVGKTRILEELAAKDVGKEGDYFNQPETGVHPKIQTEKMIKLIGVLAENENTYVVIETHSEFIFQAIKLSIKKRELCCRDVVINWIREDGGVTYLELDEYGHAVGTEWPVGCFDQTDTNLDAILGL